MLGLPLTNAEQSQRNVTDRRGKRGGRRVGIVIRPGSVRQARIEARLTLAQLGGVEVSRVAMHLIETGSTRPSLPTLEVIATRTQKPLGYFLVARIKRSG